MNVPSPEMVTTLSASHVVVFGVYKHVAPAPLVCSPVPVARPEPPVMVVKLIVPPGSTDFVSGLATGGAGVRIGVSVEVAVCPTESVTRYVIEVLVPAVAFASAK